MDVLRVTLGIVRNTKYCTTHREIDSTEQSFTTLEKYVNQRGSNQHGKEDARNRFTEVHREEHHEGLNVPAS